MTGNRTKMSRKIRQIFCIALILIINFSVSGTAALSLCNGNCCVEGKAREPGHTQTTYRGHDTNKCSPMVQSNCCCALENAGPESMPECIIQMFRAERYNHASAISVLVSEVSLNPSLAWSRSEFNIQAYPSAPIYLQKSSLLC